MICPFPNKNITRSLFDKYELKLFRLVKMSRVKLYSNKNEIIFYAHRFQRELTKTWNANLSGPLFQCKHKLIKYFHTKGLHVLFMYLRLNQTIRARTHPVEMCLELHVLVFSRSCRSRLVKGVWLKRCPSVWATLHPKLARDVTWHTADRIKRERERETNWSE